MELVNGIVLIFGGILFLIAMILYGLPLYNMYKFNDKKLFNKNLFDMILIYVLSCGMTAYGIAKIILYLR